MSLRTEFPACERVAFLNTGSNGPVPRRAAGAASDEVERQATEGRHTAYFARRQDLRDRQAAGYAARLGCAPDEVALTTSTSEGIAALVASFGPGDAIVTSDEEHPGVYGPLGAAIRRGAEVAVAPFDDLADAVDVSTTAVVCSHVSWITGRLAPAALASVGVPVLYDGAQGVGAIPVDVKVLGCAAYAGSGQKWLCGPDGSGMLYIAPELRERVPSLIPSYVTLSDPAAGLESRPWPDSRAWDAPALAAETSRFALASMEVLGEAGWNEVHTRGVELAVRLAELLADRGHTVRPRSDTTLVAWDCEDATAVNERAREAGVLIRELPGRNLLRASVGAWNDEGDLERLLALI
ncbi:MAG: aminotransferase class V-fold PLP-dependent enzyme [Solirubrobacteraceae bacterium]